MHIRLFSLLLSALLPLLMLAGVMPARADTVTIEVMHLPLDEAAAAAQSQLSAAGRTAQLPSRRLLIISDDAAHIDKARALLRQLDTAPAQLAVHVEMAEDAENNTGSAAVSASLPGGWVRLNAAAGASHSSKRRDFMLRTSSGRSGHVEAGEIRAVQQDVRQYLTAHGIVSESDVELLDVTGGFDVRATLLAGDQVRLSIRPWLKDAATDSGMDAKTEMLIDAGTTRATGQPPSTNPPLRINMQPKTKLPDGGRIMVAEAATELTVKLGERVVLAASNSAANEFSTALLGVDALNTRRDLVMTVTITRAGM